MRRDHPVNADVSDTRITALASPDIVCIADRVVESNRVVKRSGVYRVSLARLVNYAVVLGKDNRVCAAVDKPFYRRRLFNLLGYNRPRRRLVGRCSRCTYSFYAVECFRANTCSSWRDRSGGSRKSVQRHAYFKSVCRDCGDIRDRLSLHGGGNAFVYRRQG